MKTQCALASSLCLVFAAFLSVPGFAAAPENLAALVPDDAVLYVQLSNPAERLESVLTGELRRELEALPLIRAAKSQPAWVEFQRHLAEFRAATGKEALDVARGLLGREAIFALRLGIFGPEVLAVARAQDEKTLEECLSTLRKAAEATAKREILALVTTYGDPPVEIQTVDQVSFSKLGEVLVLSNSFSAVQRAIDSWRGGGKGSVALSEGFRKAVGALPQESFAYLVVRPRFVPDFRVPRTVDNVVASLLFGGWLRTLEGSEWIAAGLALGKESLRMSISASPRQDRTGAPEGAKWRAAYFPEVAADDLVERLESRGLLAALELSRDLWSWWEERDQLLADSGRTQLSGIAAFLSVVSGGRDLGSEILPRIGRRFLLVARNQDYENSPTRPQPAIPAFAAILELEGGAEIPRHVATAFQTLAGFINLDRAQKGQEPAKLEVERAGESELHILRLPESAKEHAIARNFSPCVAMAGNRLVLSSSVELGKILVEEIAKARPAENAVPGRDRLLLDGGALVAVLSENRQLIAQDNARKKGISESQAAEEFEAVLSALRLVRSLRATSRSEGDALVLEAELSLTPPRR